MKAVIARLKAVAIPWKLPVAAGSRHSLRSLALLVMFLGSTVANAQTLTVPPIAGYEGGAAAGGERVEGLGLDREKFYLRLCQAVAVSKTNPNIPGFVPLPSETGRGTDYVLTYEQNRGFFAGKSYSAYPTGADWPKGKTKLNELTPSNAAGVGHIDTTTGCADISFKISAKQKGNRYVQCMSFVISEGMKGIFWGGNGHNSKCYTSEHNPATCVVVDPINGTVETLDQLPPALADSICADVAKLK